MILSSAFRQVLDIAGSALAAEAFGCLLSGSGLRMGGLAPVAVEFLDAEAD